MPAALVAGSVLILAGTVAWLCLVLRAAWLRPDPDAIDELEAQANTRPLSSAVSLLTTAELEELDRLYRDGPDA